jgi:hypothetical protein
MMLPEDSIHAALFLCPDGAEAEAAMQPAGMRASHGNLPVRRDGEVAQGQAAN